ncbi:MAG: GNAT family N-acetyltransferase [Gammaproteobacteria bacterium]|nr:GNAT family N-acetyltransferase [Gammaproteobacteria bacterium]
MQHFTGITSQSLFVFNQHNIRHKAVIGVYPCEALYTSERQALIAQTLAVMTPAVTESLPPHYQGVDTKEKAEHWLLQRFQDCQLLALVEQSNQQLLGFLFVHHAIETDENSGLKQATQHLGYLLSVPYWGCGIATELLQSYVTYCQSLGFSGVLYAGVETANLGSIRVLQKSGFEPDDKLSTQENLFYRLNIRAMS